AFGLILASCHYLDPVLHRWFTDRIGDSPLYRRLTICSPSFLFLTDGSAAVRGYPSVTRQCFASAASALN
ncbi:hypothetical protein HAX54_012559, partial [Datura stramonium]|nr:hypothetical protein [Datura stramonium]